MIFGMELLSKGNKIGSLYQGRYVCVCWGRVVDGRGLHGKVDQGRCVCVCWGRVMNGRGLCVCLCVCVGEGNEWKGLHGMVVQPKRANRLTLKAKIGRK